MTIAYLRQVNDFGRVSRNRIEQDLDSDTDNNRWKCEYIDNRLDKEYENVSSLTSTHPSKLL